MFIWFWIRETLLDVLLGKKEEVFKYPCLSELAEPRRLAAQLSRDRMHLLDYFSRQRPSVDGDILLRCRCLVRERFGIRQICSKQWVWAYQETCPLYGDTKVLFWSAFDEDHGQAFRKFQVAMDRYYSYQQLLGTGLMVG